MQLQNLRKLESYKEQWWNQNPNQVNCDGSGGDSDGGGISIYNIGWFHDTPSISYPVLVGPFRTKRFMFRLTEGGSNMTLFTRLQPGQIFDPKMFLELG